MSVGVLTVIICWTLMFGMAALAGAERTAPARPAPFDHSAWERLLQRHVDEGGRVAYRNLAEQDRAALDRYLRSLAAARPEALPAEEALALYLNAYNAFAVKGVLDGHTAESLVSRTRFFRVATFRLAERDVTLDTLEQRIIRPAFPDPRIHFALVCASASCPRLARRAYTGGNLDSLLDEQGRSFLADRARNPLGQGPVLTVSSIFDWYEEDFRKAAGSLQRYLARVLGPAAPPCLRNESCSLEFARYDWTLNAQPAQRP